MVNIFAAANGREGNPGDYRDYRLKRERAASGQATFAETAKLVLKS